MNGLTGQMLGPYRMLGQLGRGGMAEVYRAYQPSLDRYVAIKVMYAHLAGDQAFVQRFEREARAVARLQHPNILQVFDFGIQDGNYYMVMPFIDGVTLKARLAAADQPLSPAEIVHIISDVADALHYAHGEGMVHRDIKPSNVMINRAGLVVLTDFGIAKMVEGPQFTVAGSPIGTPEYMSPEQCLGDPVDGRSDIYSLGIVLYEVITGRVPFTADTPYAVATAQLTKSLPLPRELKPDLPAAVEKVILKALAKKPEDRYQTAAEFAAAVRGMLPEWEASLGKRTKSEGANRSLGPRTEVGPALRDGTPANGGHGQVELLVKILLAALGVGVMFCGTGLLASGVISSEPAERVSSAQGVFVLCIVPGLILLVAAAMLQFRGKGVGFSPLFLTALALVGFATFSSLCGTVYILGSPFEPEEVRSGSLLVGLPCFGLGIVAFAIGAVLWFLERKKAQEQLSE